MVDARLLDPGRVTPLRSQTIYHAVAECAAPGDPVTLCLPYPDRPYVSIGYHQQADREIDLGYCARHGIPVLRRRVGGGAVLLDESQLFFHLVFPDRSAGEAALPRRLADRYPRLVAPAVSAYRRLGVEAGFRPANDIRVGGRKIGGTGTASIGNAFVFVGSMMLDFDHGLMARVLRFSDEAVRTRVLRSMEDHVTSLRHETGRAFERDAVKEALLESFREELDLNLVPGELSATERKRVAELDEEFGSEAWLHHVSWSTGRPRNLNINGAVRYLEAEHRAAGGLLRLCVRLTEGRVDDLVAVRDASLLSGETLERVRGCLLGERLRTPEIEARLREAWGPPAPGEGGVTLEDLAVLTRKLAAAAA